MTREEAQIIIGNIPIYGDDCYTISEYQEAKAMAIEALENSDLKCSSCRFKIFDAFSYPCIDCGRALSHYEIVT